MWSESCQAASFVHVLNDWAIRTSAMLSSLSVRTSLLAGRHRCTRAHTNNLFGVKIKVCFNLCKYTLRFHWKDSVLGAVLFKKKLFFVQFSQWLIVNYHMASHIMSKTPVVLSAGGTNVRIMSHLSHPNDKTDHLQQQQMLASSHLPS